MLLSAPVRAGMGTPSHSSPECAEGNHAVIALQKNAARLICLLSSSLPVARSTVTLS